MMQQLVLHPQRYPKHGSDRETPEDKGQVYDGLCNTTRCESFGARYWNACTHGLYCMRCASGINYHPQEPDLCVDHGKKPETLDEMKEISDGFTLQMRNSKRW